MTNIHDTYQDAINLKRDLMNNYKYGNYPENIKQEMSNLMKALATYQINISEYVKADAGK